MTTGAVLFSVHWLTDFGGLHENVLDTVASLARDRWRCVVIAPKARFNTHFRKLGAEVIENDLSNVEEATRLALAAGPFDLVHAHPFQGRALGVAVAKACKAKLILTMHGQYLDEIDDQFDAVVCVSDRVADYVRAHTPVNSDRVHVIPNAVDTRAFRPSYMGAIKRRFDGKRVITVCSRIDPDKEVLFRCVTDLADYLAQDGIPTELNIQGENFYGEVAQFLKGIQVKARKSFSIRQSRWCDSRQNLAEVFNTSDIVIASGRGAAESLACLRPTIAVASRGYVGLLERGSIELAIATNFGGCREPATEYSRDRLLSDFHKAQSISKGALQDTRIALLSVNSTEQVHKQQCSLARRICA